MSKEFLTVAKIVKPQGIRGEVKALTYTDDSSFLEAFESVYIGGNAYKILKVRPQEGDCAFITLAGIADRNAAELLRGQEIEVLRNQAPALPQGTYYIGDIVGCKAVDDTGRELGTVTAVIPARTDIYEVASTGGGTLTFPAVEGLILSVDIESGVVTLNKKRLAEVALEEK